MSKTIVVRIVGDTGNVIASLRAVGAQAGATAAQAETMGTRIGRAGSKISTVGSQISRNVSAPLGIAGFAAAKLASDFEASMSKIVGLVGLSKTQVSSWSEDILQMSRTMPAAPKELADALYFVTSAGIPAGEAMEVVRVSARAAAAGLGETQVVADAVTSAMNAYGTGNLSAAAATDVLTATVKEGKGEPEDLAQAIGRVIAPAQALGISFDQVGAAMASMTLVGLDANEAATALSGIMTALRKPSSEAEEALAGMGLSAAKVRDVISKQGLLAGMNLLRQATGGNAEAISKLFPEVRGLNGFMIMTGENAAKTAGIFNNLANSAGTTDKAFAAASETADFKFRTAMSDLQATGIELGAILLPILTDLAGNVADVAGAFGNLSPEVQKVAVAAGLLLVAIGPMTSMVGTATTALGGMAKAAAFLATSSAAASVAAAGIGAAVVGGAIGFALMARQIQAVQTATDEMVREQAVATNTAALGAAATREQAVAAYMNAVALNKQTDAQKGAATYGAAFAATQAAARQQLDAIALSTGVARERIVQLANEMGVNLGDKSEKGAEGIRNVVAAATSVNRAVTPTQRLEYAQEALGNEVSTSAEKFDALKDAIDAALGVFLDADEAALNLQGKVRDITGTQAEVGVEEARLAEIPKERDRDLAAAVKDRDRALASGDTEGAELATQRIAEIRKRADEETAATKKRIEDLSFGLKQAPIDLARAAIQEADALLASGQLAPEGYEAFLAKKLAEIKAQFPAWATTIDGYIAKVRAMPDTKHIVVTADASQALAVADAVNTAFGAMSPRPSPDVAGPTLYGAPVMDTAAGGDWSAGGDWTSAGALTSGAPIRPGGGLDVRDRGGPVRPGESYLIGGRPELLTMGSSRGYVTSNSDLMAMNRAGSAPNVTVNMHNNANPLEVAAALSWELR